MKTPMGWWRNMIRTGNTYETYLGQAEEEYIVQDGDTPESIAAQLLDDPKAYSLILSYNALLYAEIRPGVKIYLPKETRKAK